MTQMTGKYSGMKQWLDAHTDTKASLFTFSHCVTFSDTNGDKDYKLVVLDIGSGSSNAKLKVYQATRLVSENTIIDIPSGLVNFYMDYSEPSIPVLAVASGPHVYIYKNLRPFFKFTVPPENACLEEQEVWGQAKEAANNAKATGGESDLSPEAFMEMLNELRLNIGEECLTERSQQLLTLDNSEWIQFIGDHCNAPLKKQSVVSCMTTLKKTMPEEDAPSCVVVGTEDKKIYILDPEAFTIIEDITLNSVPAFLATSGLYDVDYQVYSACREGCICVAGRGTKVAECLIMPESLVVSFVIVPPPAPKTSNANPSSQDSSRDEHRVGASIVLALSNQCLQSYSRKGKKHWEITLPSNAKTMISVPIIHLGITLVAVALSGGVVNFYHEKVLVDVLKFTETVSALSFGRYGQEDNTLVAVTCTGILHVKILKRTSNFGVEVTADGDPLSLSKAKEIKVSIPKRTKEYVKQSSREQENATQIHQAFQQDLLHLRKLVDRFHLENVNKCRNSISSPDNSKKIKLTSQIQGLGPVFKIILNLETLSSDAAEDLAVTFHWDPRIYSIDKPFMRVPLLVPKFQYYLESFVRHLSNVPTSDKITVVVVDESQGFKKKLNNRSTTQPGIDKTPRMLNNTSLPVLVTAIIDMPLSQEVQMD